MKKQQWLLLATILLIVLAGLLHKPNQLEVTADKAAPHSETAPAKPSESTKASKEDFFTSTAGIRYGKDWSGKFNSRIAHIMAHTKPDPNKIKHSVFVEQKRDAIIALIDEAWKKRGPPKRDGGKRGRDVYDVPLGRVIGTHGEKGLRIVVEPDSADIVTAYPVP